jgi:hypothetical protein
MQGSLHIPQFSTSTKSVRSYHTGIYYGAIIYGIFLITSWTWNGGELIEAGERALTWA